MAIFYITSCQTEVGGHIVYIKGIPMMLLLGKPLGIGKEKSIIYLFCSFSSYNHPKNQYTWQIYNAVNREYLPQRFQVENANKL